MFDGERTQINRITQERIEAFAGASARTSPRDSLSEISYPGQHSQGLRRKRLEVSVVSRSARQKTDSQGRFDAKDAAEPR